MHSYCNEPRYETRLACSLASARTAPASVYDAAIQMGQARPHSLSFQHLIPRHPWTACLALALPTGDGWLSVSAGHVHAKPQAPRDA